MGQEHRNQDITRPAHSTADSAMPSGSASGGGEPGTGRVTRSRGSAGVALSRLLVRGESAVASIGIAAAAILLCAMASLSWWTHRAQRHQLQEWRADQVRSVGSMLAGNLELLLQQGDLSPLRRLVAEAGRAGGFATCRVTLPDGRILADAEPSRINLQQLPDTWTRDSAARQELFTDAAQASAVFPMSVPGRGSARLELVAPLAAMPGMTWETQAGIGAIGAGALLVLLVAYRRLRGRMRALGAVREALLALSGGETSTAVLAVNPQLGMEAAPWNALLSELEALRRQMNVEQARQALGARRAGRGDLDAAFDALPQGLLLVDEQLKVRYANGAAAAFLQAKRDQLPSTDLSKWIAQDEVLSSLQGVSDGTVRRKSVEVEQHTAGGAATVLRFTIRPVRREDCAAAMIVIEDITQQKVAAESRNHFVAQATHELRTPLTNIRLYVETAIEEGETDAEVRGKCLNVINQETRRLERIVGEMLSVAEIEAGSLKISRGDLRVDQLFEELRGDFEQAAQEKQVTLEFKLPPKMPVIKADRDKVAVALHNLIGNALKYTPEGGAVRVTLDVEPRQLVVSVSDTGIGISDEDQPRVFDRFYRAPDPRVGKITGTGLGLTLAREVVRLHGGDITLRSELNKGSTFTLTLPSYTEAA